MVEMPFTPGRDARRPGSQPIIVTMDSAVGDTPTTDTRVSTLHLLRDCFALGRPESRRPPAKVRLEAALGPELTRKVLRSLDTTDRR